MRLWLNFCEACIQFSSTQQTGRSVIHINLYWKDGHSGITVGFCKHKSSFLYNQAVEVIYSFLYNQAVEAKKRRVMPDIGTYYPNSGIAQASEQTSNRKHLLKVT